MNDVTLICFHPGEADHNIHTYAAVRTAETAELLTEPFPSAETLPWDTLPGTADLAAEWAKHYDGRPGEDSLAEYTSDVGIEYDSDYDNCAGMPGCGDVRVLFRWYQEPAACCPRCYENIFGGPPAPDQRVVTLPPAD